MTKEQLQNWIEELIGEKDYFKCENKELQEEITGLKTRLDKRKRLPDFRRKKKVADVISFPVAG